jgi:uncharacterized protein (DUF488 family)
VIVHTAGHGTRAIEELIATLRSGGVRTLVDVRLRARSRWPQFNQRPLAARVEAAAIEYIHKPELGGLRANEAGEERFGCIRVAAFRSYAARMGSPGWQRALEEALAMPFPCFMCAETSWLRCHRRLIAELLAARGHEVVHLLDAERSEPHRQHPAAESRSGRLYLCGELVA